jgi:hypothetical protein
MSNIEALQKLRVPFEQHQISYLPKGGVKLAYVGHAALTDRLLSVDPLWTWEPVAHDARGLPLLDDTGGLWIKLTVCGVTRLGYGDAGIKKGGDAMKERIGDALRNAGMRFGAALDLWHKGDLHAEEERVPDVAAILKSIANSMTMDLLKSNFTHAMQMLDSEHHPEITAAKDKRKAELTQKENG